MDIFSKTFLGKLRQISGMRIVPLMLALALVLGLASFVRGVSANPGAAGNPQTNPQATPTMAPMPGMIMATPIPANPQTTAPTTGNDMDVLLKQMQDMLRSLQGVMGQLDQKSATLSVPPTPLPTAAPVVDMQAMMAEIQDINRIMGPLMIRIQADLLGTPSADELASVRKQVEQLNVRMNNLMTKFTAQLQASRGNTAPTVPGAVAPVPTMAAMPGMNTPQQPAAGSQQNQSQAMMSKLEQMMQQMQGMLQQIQGQAMQPGNMPGQTGGMTNMATPAPMAGMGNMPQATPMPGMAGSSSPMDSMMMMMNNMMMMMDSMMMKMDGMMGMPDM